MEVNIKTVNFEADKRLIKFVDNKVKKLDKFFDGIVGTEVFLTVDKSKSKGTNNKEAKILVEVPGYELFAEKQAKTFEEAVDSTMGALEKQIKKFKEKKKD